MALVKKTEGIVLQREDFRSQSKFITLFSLDYGRLALLAKGGFHPKRYLSGPLEPFNLIEVIFYHREGRDYHLLSETSLLLHFPHFRTDGKRFYYASLLASFLIKTLPREVRQPSLYRLSLRTLSLLDEEGKENFLYAFFLKSSSLLGYRPHLLSCLRCGKGLKSFFFSPEKGGFLCGRCRNGEGREFLPAEAERMRGLLFLPLRKIGGLELGAKEKEAIRDFLCQYFHFPLPNNPFLI
ncbi:MAG: DNA repair protein RecO [candidate division WOR-3 bacterium]